MSTKKRWRYHTEGAVLHVWPTNDLVKHDTTDDEGGCVCGPQANPVQRDDGSIGWYLKHFSLDGREQHEG